MSAKLMRQLGWSFEGRELRYDCNGRRFLEWLIVDDLTRYAIFDDRGGICWAREHANPAIAPIWCSGHFYEGTAIADARAHAARDAEYWAGLLKAKK